MRFTWTNADPQAGDFYIVEVVTLSDTTGQSQPVEATEIVVPAAASGQTCIDVTLVRSNGTQQNDPTRGCTP